MGHLFAESDKVLRLVNLIDGLLVHVSDAFKPHVFLLGIGVRRVEYGTLIRSVGELLVCCK